MVKIEVEEQMERLGNVLFEIVLLEDIKRIIKIS